VSIIVSVAAESKQLTTLATVKELLSITVTTDDVLINKLIDRVSASIVGYCGLEFAQQTYIETLATRASLNLSITHTPLVDVVLITFDGVTVDASDYKVQQDEAGLIFNKYYWCNTGSEQKYSVTYKGGYVLPSFTIGTRNLPEDIEFAVLENVKQAYLTRKENSNIQAESVPNVYSRSMAVGRTASLGLGDSTKLLLAPYRRRRI